MPETELIVSNREYEEVSSELRLSQDYFLPGSKVLSVGEGLSNFASTLSERGVDIIAVDPIYSLGNEIFEKSTSDTERVITQKYRRKVRFKDYRYKGLASNRPKEPLVAGSVYELPFSDDSFTNVLGYRIFEHIDLSIALPEMARVLKKTGEIRLGGALLNAIPNEGKLLTGILQYDGSIGNFYFSCANKLKEAFLKLSGMGNLLKAYVVLDGLPGRSEVRNTGAYVAGTMIIRKDDVIPNCVPFPTEERKQCPYLGEIYQVDFSRFVPSQDYGGGYYQLVPVEN